MGPVLFRVDATKAVGLGHLMRCIALAEAVVAAGGVPHFVAKPDPLMERIAKRGWKIHPVDGESGDLGDAERIAALSRTLGARTVVIDGYVFGADFLEHLDGAGLVACYVDDFARGPFPCAAVLNHNLMASAEAYAVGARTTLILGRDYALVRDEILGLRQQRSTVAPEVARRVLVTMGSADPTHQTPKVLRAIDRCPTPFDVRVMVGPGCDPFDVPARTHQRIELVRDAASIGEHMLWCDLAVSATGVTSYELASIGVPAIAFAVVDNQEGIARSLAELDLMQVPARLDEATLAEEIGALAASRERRASMMERQRKTIDGEGKHRVVQRLREIAGEVSC